MCSHLNCLIEAILMSTDNIPFSIKKKNHPKLSQICSEGFFQGSQERVLVRQGKRAISVRAIEVLLYHQFHLCYALVKY